jgi:hypothetical protein
MPTHIHVNIYMLWCKHLCHILSSLLCEYWPYVWRTHIQPRCIISCFQRLAYVVDCWILGTWTTIWSQRCCKAHSPDCQTSDGCKLHIKLAYFVNLMDASVCHCHMYIVPHVGASLMCRMHEAHPRSPASTLCSLAWVCRHVGMIYGMLACWHDLCWHVGMIYAWMYGMLACCHELRWHVGMLACVMLACCRVLCCINVGCNAMNSDETIDGKLSFQVW